MELENLVTEHIIRHFAHEYVKMLCIHPPGRLKLDMKFRLCNGAGTEPATFITNVLDMVNWDTVRQNLINRVG